MNQRDTMNTTVPIKPIGKPRMTQRDKWDQRPAVMRYRAFADELRLRVGPVPALPLYVGWVAYFPMPKSWSNAKREKMAGTYHRQKPDRDNIDKAILDALWKEDSCIADGRMIKRWDDGDGPRIFLEIRTLTEPE